MTNLGLKFGVLNREVSSWQMCLLREVPLYSLVGLLQTESVCFYSWIAFTLMHTRLSFDFSEVLWQVCDYWNNVSFACTSGWLIHRPIWIKSRSRTLFDVGVESMSSLSNLHVAMLNMVQTHDGV
jgi:hypothetical protein